MTYATATGTLAHIWVPGAPKTKGSMTHIGNGQMRDTPASKSWRRMVAERCRTWRSERGLTRPAPLDVPVCVAACWHLPVDPLRSGAGDIDKLLRNALDALASDAEDLSCNGGAYVNDNQITMIASSTKVLAGPNGSGLKLLVSVREDDWMAMVTKIEHIELDAYLTTYRSGIR